MQSIAFIGGEQDERIMGAAKPVLEAVGDFEYYEAFANPAYTGHFPDLPPGASEYAAMADAIMLDPYATDTEAGSLAGLRWGTQSYVTIQPVKGLPAVIKDSPLKHPKAEKTDLVVVQSVEDFDRGESGARQQGGELVTFDEISNSEGQIRSVARVAFDLATQRAEEAGWKGSVTSVDKANVMETSRLWRRTVSKLQKEEYPDVRLEHVLADNAAMKLVAEPQYLDVILSNRLFGDILAGASSAITDPSVVPAGSLNELGKGIYYAARPEGKGAALVTTLSVAMALRHSLDMPEAAIAVEQAVADTLKSGIVPRELGGVATDEEFTEKTVQHLND